MATISERKRDSAAVSWYKKSTSPFHVRSQSQTTSVSRTVRVSSHMHGKWSSDTRISHYTAGSANVHSQIGAALFKDNNKPQRPSKRARQRIRKKEEKLKSEQSKQPDAPKRHASESGYETTGDTQTPTSASPVKSSVSEEAKTPLVVTEEGAASTQQPHVAKTQNALVTSTDRAHRPKRTDSTSSSIGFPITDISLRKQMKDLQRCEKCIAKYESTLDENCEVGMKKLKQVFSTIRQGVSLREEDLINDLVSIRNTASLILQRRKETASFLKKAVEQSSTLEDVQIDELKEQIKQFVTDRKVDEEIGTITRFEADQDDIIPQIMGFGKVNDVRHLYTAWEEDPGAMIEMSKYRLNSLPSISALACSIKSTSEDAEQSDSQEESASSTDLKAEVDSAFIESSEDSVKLEVEEGPTSPQKQIVDETEEMPVHVNNNECAQDDSAKDANKDTNQATAEDSKQEQQVTEDTLTSTKNSSLSVAQTSPSEEEAAIEHTTQTTSPNTYTNSALSSETPEQTEKETSPEQNEKETSPKETPSKYHTIVLLKPPKILREKPTDLRIEERVCTQVVQRYSPEELVVIQSRVRDSLQQQGVLLYDPVTGARPIKYHTQEELGDKPDREFFARKQKTPTQLRRERKKRQRERERRQKELEEKIRKEIESSAAASNTETQDSSSYSIKSATYSSSESLITTRPSSQRDELTSTDQLPKRKKKHKVKQVDTQDTDDPAATGTDSDNEADSSSDNRQPTPSSVQEADGILPAIVVDHTQKNNVAESPDDDDRISATNDVITLPTKVITVAVSNPAEEMGTVPLADKIDIDAVEESSAAESRPMEDSIPYSENESGVSENESGILDDQDVAPSSSTIPTNTDANPAPSCEESQPDDIEATTTMVTDVNSNSTVPANNTIKTSNSLPISDTESETVVTETSELEVMNSETQKTETREVDSEKQLQSNGAPKSLDDETFEHLQVLKTTGNERNDETAQATIDHSDEAGQNGTEIPRPEKLEIEGVNSSNQEEFAPSISKELHSNNSSPSPERQNTTTCDLEKALTPENSNHSLIQSSNPEPSAPDIKDEVNTSKFNAPQSQTPHLLTSSTAEPCLNTEINTNVGEDDSPETISDHSESTQGVAASRLENPEEQEILIQDSEIQQNSDSTDENTTTNIKRDTIQQENIAEENKQSDGETNSLPSDPSKLPTTTVPSTVVCFDDNGTEQPAKTIDVIPAAKASHPNSDSASEAASCETTAGEKLLVKHHRPMPREE